MDPMLLYFNVQGDSLSIPVIPLPWLLILTIVVVICALTSARSSRHKLPPGPPRWPIIGNALEVPEKHLASYLSNQVARYGGLVSLEVFGTTFIVIGELELAKELLQKRSAKYSSRPVTEYYKNHIDPASINWAFIPQGDNNLIGRRLTRSLMNDVRESGITCKKLSLSGRFRDCLWTVVEIGIGKCSGAATVSMVFAVSFGKHLPTGNEEDYAELVHLLDFFLQIYKPSSLVNTVPLLDYIPGPMPWRKAAQDHRDRQSALYSKLVSEALKRQTDARSTWTAAFVDVANGGDYRHLVSELVEAAMETTTTSFHVFFLACMMHPEWIPRAQKMIDEVVGPDEVPQFSDRHKLPYIDAVVREVLRWRPAIRAGIPHVSTAEDIVQYQDKEYFIPKGSLILPLAWNMEHDSSRYHEPDQFFPERFLDETGDLLNDYETSSFGFGRRKCPGASFAERMLWINIANILWCFHIRRSEDIDPKTGYSFRYSDTDDAFHPGLISDPLEFPVSLVPRSAERVEVLKRTWEMVKHDFVVA